MNGAKQRTYDAGDGAGSTPRMAYRLKIDPHEGLGIRDQIHAQLASLISSGASQKGMKLPSCRALAKDLNVSVNSVLGRSERPISSALPYAAEDS